MDLEELLARLAQIDQLADDELAQAATDLQAAAEEVDPTTDDGLAALEQIATALDGIRAEQAVRETAAAEREDRAAEALARIRGESGDGDGDEGEPDEGADPEAPAVPDETPADPEVPAEAVREPEAVAAAASRITRQAVRRPRQATPRPAAAPAADDWHAMTGLTAGANAPGVTAGAPLRTRRALAEAMVSAFDRTRSYSGGVQEDVVVATAGTPEHRMPEVWGDRFLGSDPNVNMERIEAAVAEFTREMGPNGLTAAGGICLPRPVVYDLPTLGTTDRPVRDRMMVSFGATRGGIQTIPSPTLAGVTAASPSGITTWTNAIDIDPQAVVKTCLELDCPTPVETLVAAIVSCMSVSNVRARFSPEQVAAWTDLLAVWVARYSEVALLTSIGAGSVAMTGAAYLGANADTLDYVRRLLAGVRNANRTAAGQRWILGFPQWYRDFLIQDLLRRMPGHQTHEEDLAVAEATIDNLFATLPGVSVVWFMDGVSGQIMAQATAGAIPNYPTSVVGYFYPAGAWLFLDGGGLNLGLVRDSVLNATNKAQLFQEQWEGAHYRGPISYKLTLTLTATGVAQSLADKAGATTATTD